MKFVLATGFQHFWRGRAQKERMSVYALLFSLGTFLNFAKGALPRGGNIQPGRRGESRVPIPAPQKSLIVLAQMWKMVSSLPAQRTPF